MIIVIKASSEWCPPCRVYEPIFDQVKEELSDVEFRKFDVDSTPDWTIKYKINSIPTTIILKDGVEVNRFSGVKSKKQLIDTINSFK